MDVIGFNDKFVRFLIDNEWLSQFNLTVDDIISGKPYTVKVTNEMFRYARKKFKVKFYKNYPCYIFRASDSLMFIDIIPKQAFKKRIRHKEQSAYVGLKNFLLRAPMG